MIDCLVTIKVFEGDTDERTLVSAYTNVRCVLTTASTQTAVLYENVPLGQLYEYLIQDQKVQSLPDGSEITITDPQQTGYSKDQVFVSTAHSQKQVLGSRSIITGACYLKS